MRSRRYVRRPPDLTSLFDVLFIVVFASLIRAAAVQKAAAQGAPAPPRPVVAPMPLASEALHRRALTGLGAELASRTPLVIRVSSTGTVVAIEVPGRRLALDVPLLEHSPDPDVALSYLGDRSAELHLCKLATLHLGVPDLAGMLVIVAPERALVDLPHALFEGLHRDLERCLTEQRGLATLVDPTAEVP